MKTVIVNRPVDVKKNSGNCSLITTRFDNFNTAQTNLVITCDITEEELFTLMIEM